jgi:hypothetical protein
MKEGEDGLSGQCQQPAWTLNAWIGPSGFGLRITLLRSDSLSGHYNLEAAFSPSRNPLRISLCSCAQRFASLHTSIPNMEELQYA